jgi:hypothetical protein
MQAVTLFLSVLISAAVFSLKPVYGLILYIAALAWYPSYLSVSVGTIDFTVGRIVILVIFANLFLRTNLPRQLKFIWLDKLVVIYFLCQILAGSISAQSVPAFIENRAGAVFDMVLPYFAVRMIVTNKKDYLVLLKGILIIAAPLAIVGFYECMTSHNPVGFLRKYHARGLTHTAVRARYGFYRARVTFAETIMFGLFFAMLGPICAGILYKAKQYKTLCWLGLGLIGVGVFSSMSSGPMLAALLSILFIASYRWRKYWKPAVIIIIMMCGLVEIVSNRHFYDVLGGFTLNPATAWYRSKLIDVAVFDGGMSGHWLTGFGQSTDPGWGLRIDGRRTDAVNHYLLILARYGLTGLVPFLAMCTMAVKRLVDAYNVSIYSSDKWLVWCLSAALFGLGVSLVSVSLFEQPATIFYMMIGLAGVMPTIVISNNRLVPTTGPALNLIRGK